MTGQNVGCTLLKLNFFNSQPRPKTWPQSSKCTFSTCHELSAFFAYSAAERYPGEFVRRGPFRSVNMARISITCDLSIPSCLILERTTVSGRSCVCEINARGELNNRAV